MPSLLFKLLVPTLRLAAGADEGAASTVPAPVITRRTETHLVDPAVPRQAEPWSALVSLAIPLSGIPSAGVLKFEVPGGEPVRALSTESRKGAITPQKKMEVQKKLVEQRGRAN